MMCRDGFPPKMTFTFKANLTTFYLRLKKIM